MRAWIKRAFNPGKLRYPLAQAMCVCVCVCVCMCVCVYVCVCVWVVEHVATVSNLNPSHLEFELS